MSETIFGADTVPLAHFYLIEGAREAAIALVERALLARGIETTANPDVTIEEYMSFTADAARALRVLQSEHAVGPKGKFYVISAQAITREAEQMLLKVLEDPAEGVHFIFIVRSLGHVADTIKSRAQIRRVADVAPGEGALLSAHTFLKSSKPERLAIVAKFLKSHEDDESTGALRDETFIFLGELEHALGSLLSKNQKEIEPVLHYIYDAKRYLGLRGMSMKMMLEYLALAAPAGK